MHNPLFGQVPKTKVLDMPCIIVDEVRVVEKRSMIIISDPKINKDKGKQMTTMNHRDCGCKRPWRPTFLQ